MSIETPPSVAELEISVLGGGKSYGESLVIHLGNNQWGIIDNCNNQQTKKSLALEYLDKINVSLKNVEYIICTHWHQDHSTSIANLFEKCTKAEFYISAALNCKEFEHYICLKSNIKSNFNAAKEFKKLIEYANTSNRKLTRVTQDQLLYKNTIANQNVELFALSPNEETKQYFEKSLGLLLKNPTDLSTVATKPAPNLQSIVSYLKIGQFTFLFGADLEIVKDDALGWNGVLKSKALVQSNKSIYFKIPHHGSENGYDKTIWRELINQNETILTTTPIITGKTMLPNTTMIKTLCDFSNNFYLTSNPAKIKAAKHSHKIQKFIDSQRIKITKIPFEFGQVRYRLDLTDTEKNPSVELFGASLKVDCKKVA